MQEKVLTIDPNAPEGHDAALALNLWKQAINLMFFLQGKVPNENKAVLSMAALAWSIRLCRLERDLSKEDFMAQAESIWESGMVIDTDENLKALISSARN